MNRVFFTLAALGLVLSFAVHLYSAYGIDIGEQYPVNILHFLLIVPMIAAVLHIKKDSELKKKTGKKIDWFGIEKLNVLLRNKPKWLPVLIVVLVIYTVINGWFFANPNASDGVLGYIDGQDVFHNHGEVIRIATEEDIVAHNAKRTRFSSGMWMPFYAFTMAVLYPENEQKT